MENILKSSDVSILSDTMKFNKIFSIVNQYINSLTCYYDTSAEKCYYTISDLIKINGTNMSLSKLIQIIEFGDKGIPPMNWIRHSYLIFEDIVMRNKQ